MPKLVEGDRIFVKQARHPLIDAKQVVPIDFTVGGDVRALLVTGPNTGGKTVTLKTAGLFVLLAQSGLFLPCEKAEMPVFRGVYADIGDEQSIEQSLSTFSSHMVNIVFILKKARRGVLVLLDELGAGTDPVEGAALAISILETMVEKGAVVACTTHYSELKSYAMSHPGFINAGMEFDVESLRPTYKLMIGYAGSSNAFAISSRLGIPSAVIERAKQQIDSEAASFEKALGEAEQLRRLAEEERARLAEELQAKQVAFEKELEARQAKAANRCALRKRWKSAAHAGNCAHAGQRSHRYGQAGRQGRKQCPARTAYAKRAGTAKTAAGNRAAEKRTAAGAGQCAEKGAAGRKRVCHHAGRQRHRAGTC
ncbi:MAG: endonuclease MutS2 [Christensenellales bacterium]